MTRIIPYFIVPMLMGAPVIGDAQTQPPVVYSYEINPLALRQPSVPWRWTGEGYLNDTIVTPATDLTITYTHAEGGAWQSYLFLADNCNQTPEDIVLHLYHFVEVPGGAIINAEWVVPAGKSLCYDSNGDRAYMTFFGEYR